MTAADIPLFPLRSVLFPGGFLPLRIFEQRYLTMIRDCARNDSGFGVCLIREGAEAIQPVSATGESTYDALARIDTLLHPFGVLSAGTGRELFRVRRTGKPASALPATAGHGQYGHDVTHPRRYQ